MAGPGVLKILRDEGGESYEDGLMRRNAEQRGFSMPSHLNFEKGPSDIDTAWHARPTEEPSKFRAIMSGLFALRGRGDPISAYHGSMAGQRDSRLDSRRDSFWSERSHDDNVTDREREQEFYIDRSLGGNVARPRPSAVTQHEYKSRDAEGRMVHQPYAMKNGRIQMSEDPYTDPLPREIESRQERVIGRGAIQSRNIIRSHMVGEDGEPNYEWIDKLAKQAGVTDGMDISDLSTANSNAAKRYRELIESLEPTSFDGKVGSPAWKEYQQEAQEMHDYLLSPLQGRPATSSQMAGLDAENAYRLQNGLPALDGEGNEMKSSGGDAGIDQISTEQYVPADYENMGRGVLPALGAGLYNKAEQLVRAPLTAGEAIGGYLDDRQEDMKANGFWDQQPSFGSMQSESQRDADLENNGPYEDRPIPRFLSGIGKSITEPGYAFLMGGVKPESEGGVDQDQSSLASMPDALAGGGLDAMLLQHYTPVEIMRMSDQQKQEALERIQLNGK